VRKLPKRNKVYVFLPKGIPPAVRSSIESSLKSAVDDFKKEFRTARKTYTSSEFLSKLKSLITPKLAGLPVTVRVATVAEVEGDDGEIASKLVGWIPEVEDFITLDAPHFAQISDPEITIRPEIPIGGVYFAPGMYKTFGKWGSTAIVGGGIGFLTFLFTALAGVNWKTALIASLITGGIAAGITYITMSGVEAGIPVAARR
jgi:hypothetical protein